MMTHLTNKKIDQTNHTAVMLGNFDGLHRGHQQLATTLLKQAQQATLKTVVFSFFPHPTSFFNHTPFQTIYTSVEKARLLEQLGIDTFVEYPFDQALAGLTPEAFVGVLLAEQLKCKAIIVGEGYRFGKGQSGDSALLQRLGNAFGIKTTVVSLVKDHHGKVSSTRIRDAIRNARFQEAETLLTRPYFLRSVIISGKQLGRTIGFPTVNQWVDPLKLLPPCGVYATDVLVNGKTYKGVTNVGYNPTVDDSLDPKVETHIANFDQNIYGEIVQVNFKHRMRSEIKFNTLAELKTQISHDLKEGLR